MNCNFMRTLVACAAMSLLTVFTPAQSVHVYTVDRTTSHTLSIQSSPYVAPTFSGDSSLALDPSHPLADMVIGVTAGSLDPVVPQHNMYAYRITDPSVIGSKTIVAVMTGNHNTETSGNWTFQGFIDFLVGPEDKAARLRQVAEFAVYPAVNPDGRYLATGRGNPEMTAEGFGSDHNRVWHTQGQGLSTIDAITTAMQNDTGSEVDYYFDFHSANGWESSFFFLSSGLAGCPFEQAFLDLNIGIGSSYYDVNGHPGVSMNWARTPEGLNAEYSFTPESNNSEDIPYYMNLGKQYGIALHNVLTPYDKATNPAPHDMATSVGIIPVFSWEEGWGAESHDVYFGADYVAVDTATSTSVELKGNFDIPMFSPGLLMPGMVHYWRVDEVYPDGDTVKGDIWRFKTRAELEATTAARHWMRYR